MSHPKNAFELVAPATTKTTAPALSSSTVLAEELAADSAAGVLDYLTTEEITENPDARLQAFRDVVAHIGTRHSCDFASSSKGTSVDSVPTPSSYESRSPCTVGKWKWADVMMRGVIDPWSRIRAISIPTMADLLDNEVRQILSRQERLASKSSSAALSDHTSSPHSDPGSARKPRTQKSSKTKRTSLPTNSLANHPRSSANGAEQASTSARAVKSTVSAPLDYVWRRWKSATRWYEHNGIVRLLAKLYGHGGTPSVAALRGDDAGIRSLLLSVLFPAFRDPQLPVRESAATLLGVLVDRDRPTRISPDIVDFIVQHVRCTLAKVPMPARNTECLTPAEQENTRVLEGHLLALAVLVDMNVSHAADAEVMPLLLRLSSYPASSVRQYVAQILRPPSPHVFVYLMQRLCEHEGCASQPADAETGGQNDGDLNWERQETVMMALQQHFLYASLARATIKDLFHLCPRAIDVLTPSGFATPLSVVFQAMQSPQFEVARMGTQLMPMLLQFCVRYSPPEGLALICEAFCGPRGCVQRELNRLLEQGDTAALTRAQSTVATVLMPALWFFVTVRRIVAEVTSTHSKTSSASSASSRSLSESRAKVDEVVKPYLRLERLTFASQAHRDPEGAGETMTPACVASTCALLVLTAYFARVMDRDEWHRCVEEVLKPSWWKELFATPVRRELVRLGPDFVRAVHHCGTPEQSQRVVELIPTLTAALADAQTHQQCLLIAMIRAAVAPGAPCGAPTCSAVSDNKAMVYVFHDVYTAPALAEGGEAAPLGHTWLKLFVPTQDNIPVAMLWGTPEDATGEVDVVIKRDSDVFRAIHTACLTDLFQSTKTEPPVLREIRTLMVALSRAGAHRHSDAATFARDDDGAAVDWYALSLEVVFGRLDKVCPRWRDTASVLYAEANANNGDASAGDGEHAERDEDEDEDEDDEDMCWDDWDDDCDDADGAAQGIYEAEVIRQGATTVNLLRDCVSGRAHEGSDKTQAADAQFSKELAVLRIK